MSRFSQASWFILVATAVTYSHSTSQAAACDKPSADPEATQVAISQLPTISGGSGSITAQPRAGPAQFADLELLDPGSATQPWAVLVQRGGDVPILVDSVGAGLDRVGGV